MSRIHFEVGETAVTVFSDDIFHKVAKDAIFEAREIIRRKISQDPFFGSTYYPYDADDGDDPLIQEMCRCSILSDVGPMAGVAGAVAYYAVCRMRDAGAGFAIVENGGDIALLIDRDITVGLFAGDDRFGNLALDVKRRDGIFGICSSSGKIGPSVSFGKSGISTVISENVILADQCATSLGNMIREGSEGEMSAAVERICSVEGIEGCLATFDGKMALAGELPELVKRKVDPDRSSRILF